MEDIETSVESNEELLEHDYKTLNVTRYLDWSVNTDHAFGINISI